MVRPKCVLYVYVRCGVCAVAHVLEYDVCMCEQDRSTISVSEQKDNSLSVVLGGEIIDELKPSPQIISIFLKIISAPIHIIW